MYQEAQKVFMPGPMITFCSTRKLSSDLVRAKLNPLGRTVGSCKCQTLTFTCTVTQNIYRVNHQFNCSKKCLFYLLTRSEWLKNMLANCRRILSVLE